MPNTDLASTLGALGFASLAAYLAIFGIKLTLCRRYIASYPEEAPQESPITVLQPILSGDPFLEETLRVNLLDTPNWAQFLWLIDETDPEAARITGPLVVESNGRACVVVCAPPRGDVNPKTVKLDHALAEVRTSYFAVLDDDTTLGDGDLGRAIAALENCTIFTGLPCYRPGQNAWASLVSHFVNNNSILTYLSLSRLVAPLSINGMFYVMKTESLIQMGGFEPIVEQLCDDYALARLIRSHGGVIRQSIAPQQLRTTVRGPREYVRLMHRWMVFANVLTLDQPAGVASLLFIFLALPPLLLWLAMLSLVASPALAPWIAGTLVVRHIALRRLQRHVFRELPGFSAPMSVLAELLQPLHWLHACVQTTIHWRTRHILVARDGTFRSLAGENA
jgi:ceramide glucosyltransferase